MIEREKILALLGVANADGQRIEMKSSELSELCKLALLGLKVLDAPEGLVGALWVGGPGVLTMDKNRIGKTVRVVEVGDE